MLTSACSVNPVDRFRTKAFRDAPGENGSRSEEVETNATAEPSLLMTPYSDAPSPVAPDGVTLTHVLVSAVISRTKISDTPLLSAEADMLAAAVWNATRFPSPEIDGLKADTLHCPPVWSTLTRIVVPVPQSRRKTSDAPLVSPATRFDP